MDHDTTINKDRTNYNPDKFMVFYKDGGLFETELLNAAEVKSNMAWQKKGGYSPDNFHIMHYDYIDEVFFNDDKTFDIGDIKRGVMKETVLTKFKAEFFAGKLTAILSALDKQVSA